MLRTRLAEPVFTRTLPEIVSMLLTVNAPSPLRLSLVNRSIYGFGEDAKVPDDCIQILVGTDFPLEHYQAMPMFFDDPEEISRKTIHRLRRAHEIGVKMAFGTDVVVDLPGRNRGELALDFLSVWQEAGVPAPKILRCMTTSAAELFRIQHERGAIAAGQFADIVATPGNPLEDIQQLRSIHFIMKEGKVIRRDSR